jgi:N-acetylneuraminic acid mutarotase
MERLLALALAALIASCTDNIEPRLEAAGVDPDGDALAIAATNTWLSRADMPGIDRVGFAMAMVPKPSGQSVLYTIGGQLLSGASLGRVQAYNVATNTWSRKADWPVAAYSTNGAVVFKGKIYISGGVTRDRHFRREFYMYDPTTNVWTRKKDMPYLTWGGITGVINNHIYVLSCGDREELCYTGEFRDGLELYRYDPSTDQWAFLGYSPVQYGRPMGGTMGGKLYFTGADRGVPLFTMYDPATNQWTPRSPLVPERRDASYATLDGKLYIFGGWERQPDGSMKQVRTSRVYNPASDSWSTRASMPTLRSGYSAHRVVLNGKGRIELVGGTKPGNNLQYIP